MTEENAGTILGAFIDYCAGKGVNIKSLRGQYAKTIKEALDNDYEPRFVRHVLAKMLEDRVANRPSLLRNRLVEAQTGPERRTRQTPSEGATKSIPSSQQCPEHRGYPGGTREDGEPRCGQCRAATRGRSAA